MKGSFPGQVKYQIKTLQKTNVIERDSLRQWFPTGEEFPPREEYHEFRGGISTLRLSYLFSVQ